ncbi:MAG: DUF502 domain-containing protein [Halobacteriaceae archaeon]
MASSWRSPERMEQARKTVSEKFREAMLTGIAVVVPTLVTIYVFSIGVDVLAQMLAPIISVLRRSGFTSQVSQTIVLLIAIIIIIGITFTIGFFANFKGGRQAISYFDFVMERLPGIGTVYKSFRKMGDVMTDQSESNFQDVKLVEFPNDGVYTLGFELIETPAQIRESAQEPNMQTLFLPLAPNPFMGGFLAHLPNENIIDVDMPVEEGVRAVVSMGIGITGNTSDSGLSREELESLTVTSEHQSNKVEE